MKNNKGITLIALIITIIILLILAGISISSMKDNGLFSNAEKSATKQRITQYDELIKLAITESYFEEFNTTREKLEGIQKILKNDKNFEGSNFRIGKYEENESLIITTKEKYVFAVTEAQIKYVGTEEEINDIPSLVEANIDFQYVPNAWTNGNVLVKILINNTAYKNYKIEYSYDLENWMIYEKEIEVTENNTTIYARITNQLVAAEEYATRTISIIDRDIPTMVDISKSSVSWSGSVGKVTITGKAKDELSGISEYQFSTDENIIETSSGWQSIEPTTDEITQTKEVTTEGTWYFYVKDQAGNINKNSILINISDITAPKISLSGNIEKWTNQDVILTGKSQDTESGIIAYGWTTEASEPTGTTTTGELGKWTNITQTTSEISQSVTLSSNGTRYFWTKDGTENINVATLTINKIDKGLPTMVSISKSSVTWSGSVGKATITGKAKDELSGISEYQFSTDENIIATSSGWQSIEPTTDEVTQTKEVTTGGTWYFYVKDQAGNVNKNSIVVSISDTTNPNISLTANTTSTANSVTLTGKSQDTGSGIVAYGWTANASEPTGTTTTGELGKWTNITQTTSEISQSVTLSSNGTRYFWTKDGVGNVNSASCTVSNIVSKVSISSYTGITLLRGNSGTPTLSYSGTPKQKTFSSTNTNIATVDSNGTVTAKTTTGTVTINVVLTNYDNTTVSGSCTVTVNMGVATIGSVDYSTVQNAINSTSNATVLLNWSTTEAVTVNSGKTITLNLNGNTLSSTNITISTYGTLTVYGGTVNGTENAINYYSGTLNITGGNITGNNNRGIYVGNGSGTINIQNSPTITGNNFGINGSPGNVTINVFGGEVKGVVYDGISLEGTSTINVKGGKVSGPSCGICIYENSYSNITVDSGEISGKTGIHSWSSGNITINGGTINGNEYNGIYSEIATVNINGGTITGVNYGILNVSGTVNMNNGTVTGTVYDGIYQTGNGAIYLNSGSVSGNNWAVYATDGWVYYKNYAPYITLQSSNGFWDNGRYAIYAVNYQNI